MMKVVPFNSRSFLDYKSPYVYILGYQTNFPKIGTLEQLHLMIVMAFLVFVADPTTRIVFKSWKILHCLLIDVTLVHALAYLVFDCEPMTITFFIFTLHRTSVSQTSMEEHHIVLVLGCDLTSIGDSMC